MHPPLRRAAAHTVTALLCAAILVLGGCAGRDRVDPTAGLDPVSSPDWEADMARFAAEDAASPPPDRPIVFTGSSSVRMWTTLARDFPEVPVLNRGFGGSQVRDSVWYAEQIALRYRPRQVVLYAGDNDTFDGRSAQQVLADTQAFVARIQGTLPGTQVALLGIKPSPSRVHLLSVQRAANDALRRWAATQRNVAYIDVFTPMLDEAEQPREALFLADQLHMNADGYALWRELIGPYLIR